MIAQPEWTERAEKRGLDPLGMQNAGVTLYQSLLPGISNVTLRMRYYGYYCWVSDSYAHAGATDDFAAWRSWVRRSEALYALVSARATGEGGVGGVDWANRRLAQEELVVDFAEAASNDIRVTRYLRQSLGVFGGAYYSQMVELGLFRQGKHGIQRATNGTGRSVATAFRDAIGPRVEKVLLETIRTAQVTPKQLDLLYPIIPSEIPELSTERGAYERLLFSPENVSEADASRSASLKLILLTAQELGSRPSPDEIRWHLFGTATLGDEALERQRVRWEAYHCQDLMQIAAASLLEWATDLMGEADAGRTLREIESEIGDRLQNSRNGDVATWSEFRGAIAHEAYDYRAASSTLTSRHGTAEQKAWDTVGLIAALDQRMRKCSNLRDATRLELKGHGSGRSVITELTWFSRREDGEVCELIASYVVERIVRRHSWVAMQKLRRQGDYTFLFEVRDGRLVRRSGYAPVATTPRLNPATTFLEDIWLVNEDGPTAHGRAVLGANA
ncbi:hypothetical protein [Methylobacterium sp. WL116]|uniref:hypothetical protein n=1 Tax=Methylobacterium sp. WL116 TaxID=2603889 RepID=UPI0011CC9BC4|nr:hypothetical protein [Methylobacterium sp. WL116]TXM94675.1 hypothetical protein FV223_03775 [Methylobacterium sp. WL116]